MKSINVDGLPNNLNGPEISVSAGNVCCIKMLLWGLKKLKENCESSSYNKANLLSSMILSVENLLSAVNRKQGIQTLVSYGQGFTKTIKESIKAVTKWSVFTRRERWYPLPDSAVSLSSLQLPKRRKNVSTKTLN